MKTKIGLISLIAAMGLVSANAEVDCLSLSVAVKNAASSDPSRVLELVSREVGSAPDCACEIVKAAIEGSKADPKMVAAIVRAASTAAPEKIRVIAQCAVAVAPDSLAEVQAVVAAFAAAGEVAAMGNPLDFPGEGPVGPRPGGPGGASLIGPGSSSILPSGTPINLIPPVDVQRRVVEEGSQVPPTIPPLPPVSPVNPPPVSRPPVNPPPVNPPPVNPPVGPPTELPPA